MKRTIKIVGTVVAETGVTVVRPNDNFLGGGYSDKTSRLPRAGAKRQDAPVYIPGASLRGKLRRAAQDRIETYLKAGDDAPVFSISEHYMLRQGVDITGEVVKEKSAGTINKESGLRALNPFISLFGRWRLSGHTGVFGLHPVNPDCLMVDGKGARSNDFIRSPERIGLLSKEEQTKLQQLLEEDALASLEMGPLNDKIKEIKKSLKLTSETSERDKLSQEIESLQQEVKAIKGNKTNREAIQRPLDGYEVIKPGTIFEHEILLQNTNDDELGLFIETMAEFTRDPRIGGHLNHGYGTLSMKYDVTTFPELADEPVVLGTIEVSSKGFKVTDLTSDNVLLNARKLFVEKVRNDQYDFGKFLLD